MNAHFAVILDHTRADQLSQLARRVAAEQIHLEESLLHVHEAEGKSDVVAFVGTDRGDAAVIALDRDRARQPYKRNLAIELRQTGSDLTMGPPATLIPPGTAK